MGYIFLSIALTAGIIKAYCGKKTSGYTANIKDAMVANLIRMLLCVVIGSVFIVLQRQVEYMVPDSRLIAIAALSGVSVTVFVVTWLLAVKNGAYMMVEVFLMLGVLIPMLAGYIFYDETIGVNKWIGMFILVIATLIMCSYNNSQKQKLSVKSLVLLAISGVSSGLADFSQKLFVIEVPDIPISIFNFYTYVFSGFFLSLSLLLYSKKNGGHVLVKSNPVFTKIFGYIFVMSVCLYANSYFKTKAAVYLDSAHLYPLNQGSALILSTIMSALLFHEKITLKCAFGLVVAFVGLIFINIL